MRKIPLLIIAAVLVAALGTMALDRPIAVRNGVVVDYMPGSSLTILNGGVTQTYWLVPSNAATAQNGVTEIAGLGEGARVTVYAHCFGRDFFGRNLVEQENEDRSTGNSHICAAVSIVVNSPAPASATTTTRATPAPPTLPAVTPTP